MPRAIVSVADKTGVVEFARGLVRLGWEIVSTGGTAAVLRAAGVPVVEVERVTGHEELLAGRVKTVHPAIHAGILARRDRPEDVAALRRHGYEPIDLVAVNLYPFERTVAAGAGPEEALEQIDIGGPALLRAAAKNHPFVLAVVDPADYGRVLDALMAGGAEAALRLELARKVFAHTAAYDAAIAAWFARRAGLDPAEGRSPESLPLVLRRVQELRYGENPDQPAAFYAEPDAPAGSLPQLRQLQGKELSFNNLLDADAALFAVSAWAGAERAACVIVKHTTPCGVALADDVAEAWRRAHGADPVSAFGGIVAFNRPVTRAAAEAMADVFLEVVVAPSFEPGALEVFAARKNLRVLALPVEPGGPGELDWKRVRGGFLVQRRARMEFPEAEWRVVTRRAPTPEEWRDLRFAWRAVAAVKSNAIVFAREECTLGIGGGQTSRVDAVRVAVLKARELGHGLTGSVVASDAFFPFRDGVDAAAEAGARAVVQPGGSVRDAEVIAAADEHGLAMVFTGRRVFRH